MSRGINDPVDAAFAWGVLAPVRWLVLGLAGVIGVVIAAVWLAQLVAVAIVVSLGAALTVWLAKRTYREIAGRLRR